MHTFAIYRLPFAKECTMLIQHSAPLVLSSLAELEGKKGFVIAPFNVSDKCPILLLQPNEVRTMPIKQVQSKPKETMIQFELPDFSKTEKVTGAEIGSATHELMQRINLAKKPTLETLTEALEQVQATSAVKDKVNLDKILSFFDTALGQEILKNQDKLYREQPFSMLKRDAKSQEDFVVRGILDGYLLYDYKIVLFDYKTDRYEFSSQLIERYRGQLELYAEALSRSYQIETVEKYLILLGKDQVEVVKL